MAATSTPKISSVFKQIVNDFPEIKFERGADFHWSAKNHTISHPALKTLTDLYQLLHEVGHAKLGHKNYQADAELISMELAAWKYATEELAPRYRLPLQIDSGIVQDSLDSYREWLHARSTCPRCSSVGVEKTSGEYACFACGEAWKVNEARTCQLRRYKNKTPLN